MKLIDRNLGARLSLFKSLEEVAPYSGGELSAPALRAVILSTKILLLVRWETGNIGGQLEGGSDDGYSDEHGRATKGRKPWRRERPRNAAVSFAEAQSGIVSSRSVPIDLFLLLRVNPPRLGRLQTAMESWQLALGIVVYIRSAIGMSSAQPGLSFKLELGKPR